MRAPLSCILSGTRTRNDKHLPLHGLLPPVYLTDIQSAIDAEFVFDDQAPVRTTVSATVSASVSVSVSTSPASRGNSTVNVCALRLLHPWHDALYLFLQKP
jgi:hypothetical protein